MAIIITHQDHLQIALPATVCPAGPLPIKRTQASRRNPGQLLIFGQWGYSIAGCYWSSGDLLTSRGWGLHWKISAGTKFLLLQYKRIGEYDSSILKTHFSSLLSVWTNAIQMHLSELPFGFLFCVMYIIQTPRSSSKWVNMDCDPGSKKQTIHSNILYFQSVGRILNEPAYLQGLQTCSAESSKPYIFRPASAKYAKLFCKY